MYLSSELQSAFNLPLDEMHLIKAVPVDEIVG